MQIKFNPTGTHVKGLLKVRFDLIPDPTDKTYALHHILYPDETSREFLRGYKGKMDVMGSPIDQADYDVWWDNLPKVWKTNPCLNHLISIDETTTKDDMMTGLNQIFSGNNLATIDNVLVLPKAADYISPFMRNKYLSDKRVQTQDLESLINDVKLRFATILPVQGEIGSPLDIQPQTIDVGSEAIVRAGNIYVCNGSGVFLTLIDFNNPANATGELDTCSTYLNISDGVDNFRFGTFTNTSGTTFVCTDGEAVGDVATGSIQTFTGLTIAVTSGDYIGADETVNVNCRIYSTATGGGGVYYSAGNFCDPSDSASYALLAGDILSLYGTGTESGGGWAGEYCGVAVAEFCGVTPAEIDGV